MKEIRMPPIRANNLNELRDALQSLGHAAVHYRVRIKQGNKTLLNVPVGIITAGALAAPAVAGLTLALAIAKNCHIELIKPTK